MITHSCSTFFALLIVKFSHTTGKTSVEVIRQKSLLVSGQRHFFFFGIYMAMTWSYYLILHIFVVAFIDSEQTELTTTLLFLSDWGGFVLWNVFRRKFFVSVLGHNFSVIVRTILVCCVMLQYCMWQILNFNRKTIMCFAFHIQKTNNKFPFGGVIPLFWNKKPKSTVKQVKTCRVSWDIPGCKASRLSPGRRTSHLKHFWTISLRLFKELTDSPGISLQSLRCVLLPTHGVLPWAPHNRLLICKPESSQADHSDQAIQPPKHRKQSNQWKPRQRKKETTKTTWDSDGLEASAPTQAAATRRNKPSWASQTVHTHRKVFVM